MQLTLFITSVIISVACLTRCITNPNKIYSAGKGIKKLVIEFVEETFTSFSFRNKCVITLEYHIEPVIHLFKVKKKGTKRLLHCLYVWLWTVTCK